MMSLSYLIQKSGIKRLLSDKLYLSIKYRKHFGHWMSWKQPKTFNEKIQWLKIYDRKPQYIPLADKYEVKKIVSDLIGEEYVIPTYGVWNTFDDIDFDKLPNQFVLKCTHDSGSIVICKDKATFDFEAAKARLELGLKSDPYIDGREWVYKDIHPRIIAEKFLKSSSSDDLRDYKFFCFDGIPKVMFIASNRFTEGVETTFDYYDMSFKHLPIINGHPNSSQVIEKPKTFEKMKELAAKLSIGFPHIRVDFYDVDGYVYFGEYTFYHFGGAMTFEPEKWDLVFGEWIQLPAEKQIEKK